MTIANGGYTNSSFKYTATDTGGVSKYEVGKYSKSLQHVFYLYCTGLPVFRYLASDGNSVFIETYTLNAYTENTAKAAIREFFDWLKMTDRFETYLEKWRGKDK